MKMKKTKMAAKRIITFMLVGALILSMELSGVLASYMPGGESAQAEPVNTEENIEDEESEDIPEEDQSAATEEADAVQQLSESEPEEQIHNNYISGVIWLDENEDGIKDEDEAGIHDFPVTLYQDDQAVDTDITDADGRYRFENLDPGEYVIGIQSEIIEETEYLLPLCGISGDNMFLMTEQEDETVVALSDLIRVTTDTQTEDINAGMREPMNTVPAANDIYEVKNDNTKAVIGKYPTLAEAVTACVTTDPCTITVIEDDEIDAVVEIPEGKEITLTSPSSDDPWVITQTATEGSSNTSYKARHFYVAGSLTLNNIVLAGTGITILYSTYNGGVHVSGAGAKLRMKDGAAIEKCNYPTGGGVYISDNAIFDMSGGRISGNESSAGGGVAVEQGEVSMSGGRISGNETLVFGGGVFVSDSEFMMTDGEISDNEGNGYRGVVSYGGGAFVSDSEFTMKDGIISGNSSSNGGGLYVDSNAAFTMTDGEISDNTGTDGGGIYTLDYSYINPASESAYANITIGADAEVKGNSADTRYSLPKNYDEFERFPGRLLNNDEINYKGSSPVYAITYYANNGTAEYNIQEVDSTTDKITLLNDKDVSFTALADGYVLSGWNTRADGGGTDYDLGETIDIDHSMTLYAVWQPDVYRVTTEEDDTLIGTYPTLAEAVDACLTNEACVITATQDDELSARVEIPADKAITLTSPSEDDPWTITQTATGTGDSARHFYVEGCLTLDHIILSGTGNTGAGYNGGVYVSGTDAELFMRNNAIIEQCYASGGGGVYISRGTLDMVGGEIRANEAGSYGGGVFVGVSGTFKMTGGSVSANETDTLIATGHYGYGGGVFVDDSGTFEMNGGEISDNSATFFGGGVYVYSNGSFTMECGEIRENTAAVGGGACIGTGLYVYSGEFTMNGGKIRQNKAGIGGGVCVDGSGTYEMNGGEISGNEASDGGGVAVNGMAFGSSSVFTMTAGEIINNEADSNGGGVYVISSGTFMMSDGEISGNSSIDGGGIYTGDYSNINPADEKAYSNITIAADAEVKENSASVRYSLPGNYRWFNNFPGELLNNDEINYKGSSPVYTVTYDANNGTGESYTQKTDSGTGDVAVTLLEDSDVDFTVLAEGYVLSGWNTRADGSGTDYDLGETIDIDNSMTLYAVWQPDVYIVTTEEDDTLIGTYPTLAEAVDVCLTTKPCIITATQDDELSAVVDIPSDKVITLTSSSDDQWEITQTATTTGNSSDYSARHFYVQGSLTLEQIIVTGDKDSVPGMYNGGIYVRSGAALRMGNNAVIKQCYDYSGGAIYVADNAVFEMEDGEITGNGAVLYGGGVYADGEFTMTGGKISENEAGYGGGVCVLGEFMLDKGEISNNTVSHHGGGVYIFDYRQFTMNGGEIICNSAAQYGGGVCGDDGSEFMMTDGKISGNSESMVGGGVFINMNAIFEMDGGEISENETGEYGGGICAFGEFAMSAGEITGNTATEGGAIYTVYYDYDDPVADGAYANITIAADAKVKGNSASSRYSLPQNYKDFENFPGELLNNDEINYKGSNPVYLVSYYANNSTEENYIQEVEAGTAEVSVTLLTSGETGFTEPDGYVLTGWNTERNGNGKSYDLGEKITITDHLTLYAIWQQAYEITEEYLTADGSAVQKSTVVTVAAGADYEKTAPVLAGYRYLGYRLDGGELQTGTTVSIDMVDQAHTVTFVYEEYSETIHVSVPVKLLWAAYESGSGVVTSPEYYFYNHSSYDINVTLQQLTVRYADGLDLVADTYAGSGKSEVALQLNPLTGRDGWRLANQVRLLDGNNEAGLLGKISAGDQGYFDINGTYGGDFAGFDLANGSYLQPEYKAVFCFELTH